MAAASASLPGLRLCLRPRRRQRPATAKGFLFLLLEDEFGLANVVVSPAPFERRRAVLLGETLLWLAGTVQGREGSLNLIATDVGPLLEMLRESASASGPDSGGGFLDDLRRGMPSPHQWR